MPHKFATLAEARQHILLSSQHWRNQFDKITKVNELKLQANEALDHLAGASVQTMDEVIQLQTTTTNLQEGVGHVHNMATQAMRESEAVLAKVKTVEEGTSKAIGQIGRRCNTNANRMHDVQQSMAENVLIVRGIPSLSKDGKETIPELEAAFNAALGKIKCPKLKIQSIKRLQKTKKADSKTPRVLRVALASSLEKSKLFEAIENCTKANHKVPFSCSHEIPKYALSSYKYCNKLASLCRVGDKDCRVRVYIPRGEKWPIIFIKRLSDSDFRKLTKVELAQVKAELQEREKRNRTGRANGRPQAGGSTQQEMDTTGIDNLTLGK
jgi:hypothetical protein